MGQKTIALEEGLRRLQQPLKEAGFSTVEMDKEGKMGWQQADLVIVSGLNDNLMGIQNIETQVPVIRAAGLTAGEIINLARERLD